MVRLFRFVRSWQDFFAFTARLSCVHVQSFVRSRPDCFAFMARLSCVHGKTFLHSRPYFLAFMSRFSCVHGHTFVRSWPDFRAFMARLSCVHRQIFVRFILFSYIVILSARRPPPRCVLLWFEHTSFRLGPQPEDFSTRVWLQGAPTRLPPPQIPVVIRHLTVKNWTVVWGRKCYICPLSLDLID